MSDTVKCSRCGQSYDVGRDAYWTNRTLCPHCWAVDRDSPAQGDVARQATAALGRGTGTSRRSRIRAWLPGVLVVCIAATGVRLWTLNRVEGRGEGVSATGDASGSPELQAAPVALDNNSESQAHPTDVHDAATPPASRYLEEVVRLDELYRQEVRRAPASEGVARLLFEIAELSRKLEISNEEFQKNSIYREIGHQRIVISGNFGDFVAYDGYHYRLLLKQFPNSPLADDAAYELIYITPDEYNHLDIRVRLRQLTRFLKKYPGSNRQADALSQIDILLDELRHDIGIVD